MRVSVVIPGVLLVGVAAGFSPSTRGQPAKAEAPPQPAEATWVLLRDFKLNGKLEEAEQTRLRLTAKENRLTGHYVDKQARGFANESIYTGEVASLEKSLVILRGELKRTDYVVIHAGHLVGENHFRGTWHDVRGHSGDFELKAEK